MWLAAGAAGSAAWHAFPTRPARAEEALPPTRDTVFDSWAMQMAAQHGCAYMDEGGEINMMKHLPPRGEDSSRFMWDTLHGEGMLERIRGWRLAPSADAAQLGADASPGRTRFCFLVQLGANICGHPEYIHGGFTSSLFDELFAWAAFAEKDSRGFVAAAALTANLSVDYRRPVCRNGAYLLELWVEQVVKERKIFLKGTLKDTQGMVLAEGKSMYIVLKPKAKS